MGTLETKQNMQLAKMQRKRPSIGQRITSLKKCMVLIFSKRTSALLWQRKVSSTISKDLHLTTVLLPRKRLSKQFPQRGHFFQFQKASPSRRLWQHLTGERQI